MKNELNIIGIIPARMGSSRFPGKPLAEIAGIPMVGHVWHRSNLSSRLTDLYVATCDREIYDYVESIGGEAVMTADTHERASDRAAEALLKVEEAKGIRYDVVVMIQGDEPLLRPEMIDEAIAPLVEDSSVMVSNLMGPIHSDKAHRDPNEVKVVVDPQNDALYFSREPIPSRAKAERDFVPMKQVCVIPFQRDFLLTFNELEQTPLEKIESVDMLRVLEHGYDVKLVETEFDVQSVDTESDRDRVEKIMETDPLVNQYP